jgi:membrane fusion protein (multidrug efflux system)
MKFYSVCASFALLFIFGCSNGPNEDLLTKESTYPVFHPLLRDTVISKEYVARIEAQRRVEIRSKIMGFLNIIHVKEGENVTEGELLFSIEDMEFRSLLEQSKAQLLKAKANQSAAEIELLRTQKLLDRKIISSSELELATTKLRATEADVAEAASNVNFAQIQLSLAKIKSPFAGRIDRVIPKNGSLINEGDLLTSVTDIKNVYAYFHVSEQEYLNYLNKGNLNGKEAWLLFPDGQEYTFSGKIEAAGSEINDQTGNLALKAFFQNQDDILRHGLSCKINIKLNQPNALIIPLKCIIEEQDRTFVYVVDSNQKVRRKSIVIELQLGRLAIIKSGLKPNDLVLFEGIQNVKEGDSIRVNQISALESIKL